MSDNTSFADETFDCSQAFTIFDGPDQDQAEYFEEILFDGTIPEGGGVQRQSQQQQQFSTLTTQSESSVWPDQCVETVPLASPCRVRCRSTSAAQLVYCCTANAGDEWCSFTPTGQSVQCFKRAGQSVQCFIKQGDYQPSATSLCAEPECCFMQQSEATNCGCLESRENCASRQRLLASSKACFQFLWSSSCQSASKSVLLAADVNARLSASRAVKLVPHKSQNVFINSEQTFETPATWSHQQSSGCIVESTARNQNSSYSSPAYSSLNHNVSPSFSHSSCNNDSVNNGYNVSPIRSTLSSNNFSNSVIDDLPNVPRDCSSQKNWPSTSTSTFNEQPSSSSSFVHAFRASPNRLDSQSSGSIGSSLEQFSSSSSCVSSLESIAAPSSFTASSREFDRCAAWLDQLIAESRADIDRERLQSSRDVFGHVGSGLHPSGNVPSNDSNITEINVSDLTRKGSLESCSSMTSEYSAPLSSSPKSTFCSFV
ncbi:unnamed protein product [Anisakis simplex]|uniref:SH2 domain-containing protein n=1 Tax=Anisakis simplex TaxID=6269 RepID=A0A0M3IZ40_ANISI|nr:unnamed protein product [Anisakis simplex]